MNRKEFQQWLNQFPEDTEIEVISDDGCFSYESFAAEPAQYEYLDFTNNRFVKPDQPHYQKKFLQLG